MSKRSSITFRDLSKHMNHGRINKALSARTVRSVYLVTYSQVDVNKFATRESFGQAVKESFESGNSKVNVNHGACCKENHKNGGFHYHVALKISFNIGNFKVKSPDEDISFIYMLNISFYDLLSRPYDH